MPPKIALVPLDERPVNTRYPSQIAAIAGIELLLPPVEIRGHGRTPADTDAVSRWLESVAGNVAGVVASTDFLAYGNLINARISNHSAADALPRLAPLAKIGERGTPVFAFSLITRVANANDCVEEPLYWKTFGTRFYRYSKLLHKQAANRLETADTDALASLEAELPDDLRQDFLGRRTRNHTVNLALIDLLAREQLALLLLTSDDTSEWGLPSREKRWLEEWVAFLGPKTVAKTLIHPGADEVGSALVARLICQLKGKTPSIFPLYAIEGDEAIIAPYEDRAVRLTVEGQIRACGAIVASDPESADIVLGVTTPSPRRTEWRPDFADDERAARAEPYRAFLTKLAAFQSAGKPIALGDVAYPNGADPLLMEMLLAENCPLDPARLAAFGAWNTAGNSLGTTVAQAVASLFVDNDPARIHAQKLCLAHHFVEDWAYQTEVRKLARAKNIERAGHHDPDPENPNAVAFTAANIEAGLTQRLARLQTRGLGIGLTLVPGSTRLPWNRTFETDFDLR